jgi:sialate O-acetylesterase
MRHTLLFIFIAASLTLFSQDLHLFEAFTDHAVLQRQTDHPLWGWTKRNRRVTVRLNETEVRTRADRDGKWSVELPPQPAGGPHTLLVTDGRSTFELQDIYFGDVYLLSGQSNMEWRLVQSDPDSTRARAIADPLIRQLLVEKTTGERPLEHLKLAETWKPGYAHEIADFSGVGSYFAHYLRESGVDIPIGLVHSSWGGSRIEPWLSAEVLGEESLGARDEHHTRSERMAARVREFFRQEFPGQEPSAEDRGQELGYLDDRVDLSGWATVEVPGAWESKGYENVDGIFYYRRTFKLSPEQAAGDATLYLGAIDDGDWTYINGQPVGETPNAYSKQREYRVPATVLRPGTNSLAIRVFDATGGGGFMSTPEQMYLATEAGKVPLAGTYHYRIGEFTVGQGQPNQVPTLLYNAMIAPLRDWPLSGVLWYQGESNAGAGDAQAYAGLMRTLVTFWRDRFDNEELPFYWVQLANFRDPPAQPNAPGWAILRASQTAATDLPMTGQAVITDIGEADDIHPRNKWEVGRRLSLHARRDIYGQEVQASSPRVSNINIQDDVAELEFAEVGEGLMVKLAENERYPIVKSLTVQDEEGNWHWAVGTLDEANNTLRVVNPAGTDIVRVRYAWFDNPDDANLFSKAGLPVTPFEIGQE